MQPQIFYFLIKIYGSWTIIAHAEVSLYTVKNALTHNTVWNLPATRTFIVFICSRTIGYIHGRKIWERLAEIQKLYSEEVPDLQISRAQERLFCAVPILYIPPETAVPVRVLRYRVLWAHTANLMLLFAVPNNICFCKCLLNIHSSSCSNIFSLIFVNWTTAV